MSLYFLEYNHLCVCVCGKLQALKVSVNEALFGNLSKMLRVSYKFLEILCRVKLIKKFRRFSENVFVVVVKDFCVPSRVMKDSFGVFQ